MYLLILDTHDRLITSDARRLCLYDIRETAGRICEVEHASEPPFFDQSDPGERLALGGGVIARSITPPGRSTHWVETPTTVGLYAATDLARIAVFDLGQRLDHQSLAVSADGRMLASVQRGAGAVVFDAATGAELWHLDGSIASGPSWSPNGRHLALGETSQGPGALTIIDTTPDAGGAPQKTKLPPPRSGAGLYDSPFRSAFCAGGTRVVFTSSSWGVAGVAMYDVAARAEIWSTKMPTTDDEGAEHWSAPELDLALDGALVLVGQDGCVQAFGAADGRERSRLEFERADSRHFAADSKRRGIWITRGGEPAFVGFASDWA